MVLIYSKVQPDYYTATELNIFSRENSRMRHEKNTKSTEIITFGPIHYHRNSGELKDVTGVDIHLRRQSVDVLSILVDNAGDIVSKDTLFDTVWAGIATTDDSLVQCISDIRRVLGREAIETFPKKGYRLNIPHQPDDAETDRHRPVWGFWLGIGASALIVLLLGQLYSSNRISTTTDSPDTNSQMSIAVLPFIDLSSEKNLENFSSGLGEDLTTDLSNVPGVNVIPYTSSFDYQNAESDFKEVASELGVRYLVRGTVRQNAEQFRINVALVDPFDGINLWTERYDRNNRNTFDVQEDVTQEIVNALSLKLDIDATDLQETNPDAHYMLLRGLDPLRNRTVTSNEEARVYFNRALAFDPDYPQAHANIAVTYGRDSLLLKNNSEAIDRGLQSAVSAIQLNPKSPKAYLALGLLNLALREYDTALAAARHVIELNEYLADGYELLAEAALYGGDLNEALLSIRRAKLLHPHEPPSYHWIEGHILYHLERFEEAQDFLAHAVNVNPEFNQGVVTLAANYVQLGQIDSASSVLLKAKEINPQLDVLNTVSQIPFRAGDRLDTLKTDLEKAVSLLSSKP